MNDMRQWLEREKIVSKVRVTEDGRIFGGHPFNRGALYYLLRNKTYRGMIVHRGTAHPGLHEAIVDEELFKSVQDMLDSKARRHNCKPDRVIQAPLTGRLFDGSGNPMTPSFTHKSAKRVYRYYVSAPLIQGTRQSNESLKRIAANALEKLVSRHVERLVPTYDQWPLAMAKRVEVHEQTLHIMLPVEHLPAMREGLDIDETVEVDPCNARFLRLTVPVHLRRLWSEGGNPVFRTSTSAARRSANCGIAQGACHAGYRQSWYAYC